MQPKNKASGMTNNTFARIFSDEALSDEQKKEAAVKALAFDTAKAATQNHRALLLFKEHLESERQNIIQQMTSVSIAGSISERQGKSESQAPALMEQESSSVADTLKGFFNTVMARSGEVLGGVTEAGKHLETLGRAEREIVHVGNIMEDACIEAARLNKETAEKLAATIEQYNSDMITAFPKGKVKGLLQDGTRLFKEKQANGDFKPAAVKDTVKHAGVSAAKSVGKSVGKVAGAEVGRAAAKKAATIAIQAAIKSVIPLH